MPCKTQALAILIIQFINSIPLDLVGNELLAARSVRVPGCVCPIYMNKAGIDRYRPAKADCVGELPADKQLHGHPVVGVRGLLRPRCSCDM